MLAVAFIWISVITAQTPTTVPLQDVEQRLGPFSIASDSFSVVLHKKRLAAPSDARISETLANLEIRDRNGAVAYEKTFAYELEGSAFKQVLSASARLLPGEGLAGLLIQYREDPSPPAGKEYWQLFRLRNGKLGLFEVSAFAPAPRNGFAGTLIRGPNGPQPIPVSRGEIAELRVWTGNFYVFVPIRVDWAQGRVTSGQQCLEMIGGSLSEIGCEMRVDAQRKTIDSDLGFVRLFHEANENMGLPRHVVLKKDSTIEILAAKAITRFEVTGDLIQTVLSDVWLKVLIDNNEDSFGWIHTNEDFAAVGLPAGRPPL